MEFKHLTPYLDHNVKMWVDYDGPQFISGIPDMYHVSYYDENTDAGDDLHIENVKLILHPISDLKNYKYTYNNQLIEAAIACSQYDSIHEQIYFVECGAYEEVKYWVIQKLHEWHFDTFSLIDNNSAKDINTL